MNVGAESSDLKWLVDSRSKIQNFLFELHSFATSGATKSPSQTLRFQLLAAVGFALWRAAFLADGERSWSTINEDATSFLETLVRDNAIGYVQDRKSKAWTFGYYVNDAHLRLAYYHENLANLDQVHAERVAGFLAAQRTKGESEPNSHIAWDQAYEATLEAFKNLSASLQGAA